MTAKILSARLRLATVVVDVHLDITKAVTVAGATVPDPRWMLHREWPRPPGWVTRSAAERTAWLNAIKAEIVAETAAQIASLQDEDAGGMVLAIEGTTFG